MDSKNNEYAQKYLSALNKFQEAIETNPNFSLSNDFRVSFKALASLLRKPEKHNIYSHLFMAMTGKADFYIASKPLLSKTKKFYEEIVAVQDNDQSNLLYISTFQEIFETFIGLELRDIAYDSKKFDFYIADEGGSEWDKIEHIAPQNIGAEYFGFKEKKDLMKKNKTLKFYGLTKFGKRRAKNRRINKSLLKNINNLPHNYLEPFPNIEPSYIEFAKFDQVNWLYQRIDDLEVQVKPLIFLDSSLIFQFLLNFKANGKKFPSEFTEQISNQFEFVCLPGVLFDLEEAGYTEFVIEFLKEVINLPKLLEIEKFVINYQDKLDEYGFSNLNVGILSDSVYWNFYVQFHVCVAKFLNADTILITSDLKKHYLNKNCYNGKFSFFVEPEVKPTSLKCITAKKFWKKFRLEKQKAESDNLKDFVVSSNFKEWEVPECLGKILKELDRKLIKDVNTFWLDIFRISENPVENKKYFREFVELINQFEDNAKILKDVPQFSSLIDKIVHSRSKFSDIKDYTRKIKRVFTNLIEVNNNRSFINSNELFLIVLLFKSNVSNFLRDRFYLKAKFKSPALPTAINFDLFFKDGNIHQQEMSAIIPTRDRSNTLQKIIVKSKGRNMNSIRFEPNSQHNDEFINQLFRIFLFTNYFFHKSELETVYRDFIRFIKAKKEYRAIAKGFSFNCFGSLILNTQERSLILLEPHGIYYSKLLENFLLLIQTYHRILDTSLSLELSAKILNIKKNELDILIYFLIQKCNMFREKSAKRPKYSLILQAVKELNDKSTNLSQAKTYTPYWFPQKKNKIVLHQPDLWIECESEILDNTPIYYINKKNRVMYSDKAFNVEIKGETFSADVDTGAFKSLISKDIADRLFPKQKRYKAYVSGYTQHTKHVDMIRSVPFHYNGQEFTDDFLIEEYLEKIFKAEVVIGRDGYNKMLVRYYGKTLDNLFNNANSHFYNSNIERSQIVGKIVDLSEKRNQKIPYINIGKDIDSLTPLEFKKTYKGVYSQYFKKVKDNNNRYLGMKTLSPLIHMIRRRSNFGVIYKITQVKDENGEKLNNGAVLAFRSKKIQKGNVRIGRAINFYKRLNTYKKASASNTKKQHVENALHRYGFKSFRLELLAVCKTEKEFISTEYFWQLYFNRKANSDGFDLDINARFNARLGSRGDKLEKFNMPKWEIVKLILQNKNKKQISEFYSNKYNVDHIDRSVLNLRLETFFSGSHNLQKIKRELIKPLLEISFRRGYTSSECLNYLKQSGVEIYEKSYKKIFYEDIKKIYEHSGIKFVSMTSAYQQVYLEKFVFSYRDHLLSIGIGNRLESIIAEQSEITRDNSSGRYTSSKYDFTKEDYKSWGIIEYLLVKGVSTRYIAISLGLCKKSDSEQIKDAARSRVEFYLKEKYKNSLSEFSFTNLVVFLKSHNLEKKTFISFLNSL